MRRPVLCLIPVVLALGACASPQSQGPTVSPAGLYQIGPDDSSEIQYRMLDSVNALRRNRGLAPLELNASLTSAANTHARSMSRQGRAWPFDDNGTTPYQRVSRAGYSGELIAEVYAQTYETELETLAAWVQDGAWGDEILSPDADEMGFSWYQDPDGLLWWDITLGDSSGGGGNSPFF